MAMVLDWVLLRAGGVDRNKEISLLSKIIDANPEGKKLD